MKKRTFAVGDIHGMSSLLKELIDRISPDVEDTIIFLGDYIDRGEDTKGVINLLLSLKEKTNCIFLMGNHEEMLLEYLRDYRRNMFLYNGGMQTIYSYTGKKQTKKLLSEFIPEEHMNFFNNLKLFHEDEKYIYVHAGIEPGIVMENQNAEMLLWTRPIWDEPINMGDKKLIVGHSAHKNVIIKPDKICIDTGSCFEDSGTLTAIQLPEESFIQVR
jgi:serine/threonine protein phosphatase 1